MRENKTGTAMLFKSLRSHIKICSLLDFKSGFHFTCFFQKGIGLSRLITRLALLILLFSSQINASEGGASFLDQGVGAIPRSLGNNYVGAVEGPEGIYWNAGTLVFNKSEEISATSYTAFETQYRSLLMNFRENKNIEAGIGFIGANIDGLLKTSLNPMINRYELTGNEFGYSGQGYLGTVSTKLTESIGIGLTGKIITETLDQNHALGFGVDAGILAKITSNFSAGINIQNLIQPKMSWDTASKNIDTATQAVKLGWEYSPMNNEQNIRIVSDISLTKGDKPSWGIGMEYNLNENLPIRIGFKSNAQTITDLKDQIFKFQNFSFGTGLRLGHWTIDLSWTNPQADYLDTETVLSAGYRF